MLLTRKALIAVITTLLITQTKLAAQQLDILLNKCHKHTKMTKIPPQVISYLENRYSMQLGMTDNSKKVDPGCVRTKKVEYTRELHHYYTYDRLHILHYTHHQGFGSHSHIAVIQETEQGMALIKNIRFLEILSTAAEIEKYLNEDNPSRYAESTNPDWSDF